MVVINVHKRDNMAEMLLIKLMNDKTGSQTYF